MNEILKRDLGILSVIFGICMFVLYKIIRSVRAEAEIEGRNKCDNNEYPQIIFECPMTIRVLSSIEELENNPGIYGIAYVQVPLSELSEVRINDNNEIIEEESLTNNESKNSPLMSPPPTYDTLTLSLSPAPEYREIMDT